MAILMSISIKVRNIFHIHKARNEGAETMRLGIGNSTYGKKAASTALAAVLAMSLALTGASVAAADGSDDENLRGGGAFN